MKRLNRHTFLLLPLLLLPLFFASAQEVDYNRVIRPKGQTGDDVAERLVQLAWENYPRNKAVQAQVQIAKEDVTKMRWDWLNRIQATGNINEFTLQGQGAQPIDGGRQLFYPRYNFSISLSPGMLIAMPAETRKAKQNLKIAEHTVNEQKLLMRNMVLQLYQDYLMSKQLLEIETRAMETITTEYELQEERFRQGKVMLQDYTATTNTYLGQQRARLQAESAFIKSKYALEEIIGVPLESVL
ncbi:TolC family protein [Cesiribacter andamanensis]|uniref:Outer membrane efflux protein n=1 Tax=Cesiribacter andamanensis AMV16 TaxID=1279009 RepID=M7NSH7_9BACT|nr:TolC family protein [Cesiribacter andamanensis]EMR04645.1 Outer membrane efflux protein [Cesiribacter andamanensis AMV16]